MRQEFDVFYLERHHVMHMVQIFLDVVRAIINYGLLCYRKRLTDFNGMSAQLGLFYA